MLWLRTPDTETDRIKPRQTNQSINQLIFILA